MARSIITSLAGLALGTATLLGSTAISTASPSSVLDRLDAGGVHMEYAQWRRGYRGRHYRRPRYGYRGGYRRRGIGTGALVGGLAAGALIGGAIAASQAAPAVTYVAPGPGVRRERSGRLRGTLQVLRSRERNLSRLRRRPASLSVGGARSGVRARPIPVS